MAGSDPIAVTVHAAQEADDFLPAYEAFINTDFYVGVYRQGDETPTRDFRFDVITNSQNSQPYVAVAPALDHLHKGQAEEAIQIRGAQLIRELDPAVGIPVSLETGCAMGPTKENVQ